VIAAPFVDGAAAAERLRITRAQADRFRVVTQRLVDLAAQRVRETAVVEADRVVRVEFEGAVVVGNRPRGVALGGERVAAVGERLRQLDRRVGAGLDERRAAGDRPIGVLVVAGRRVTRFLGVDDRGRNQRGGAQISDFRFQIAVRYGRSDGVTTT
jgi:hypothetical protein